MPYWDPVQTAAPAAQVTVHWDLARVFIAPSQARGGAADDGDERKPRREAGAAAGARAERLRWATAEEAEEMWGDEEDEWESF